MKTSAWLISLLSASLIGGLGARLFQEEPDLDQEKDSPAEEAEEAFDEWLSAVINLEVTRGHSKGMIPCSYNAYRKKMANQRLTKAVAKPKAKVAVLALLEELIEEQKEEQEEMKQRRNGIMIQGRELTPDEKEEVSALGDGVAHFAGVLKELQTLLVRLKK